MSVPITPRDGAQAREHPRTIGWLGTSALAMGGSNQMVFLVGALIAAQGSGAIPILIVGVLLGWAAAPGWIELVLMWPKRVGGIAATCAEAFRPYSPVLANLTGVCYWWGWVPTCGFTAILSATALHEWYLPWIPVTPLAIAVVLAFTGINLLGVRTVTRVAIPVASVAAALALLSALVPILAGTVDYERPCRSISTRRSTASSASSPPRWPACTSSASPRPPSRPRPATSARPRIPRATSRGRCSPAARWPGCSSSSCRWCGSAPSGPPRWAAS